MGQSAQSKLDAADRLNKTATNIRKKDPDSARELDELARRQRKAAIKQLKHHPRKRKLAREVL